MLQQKKITIGSKNDRKITTLGFIINPVAGMGGAVGLKGTDGIDILNKAISLGAKPIAPERAEHFLLELNNLLQNVKLFTGSGITGENTIKKIGFDYKIFGERKKSTTSEDTINLASILAKSDLDLLVFCGGDGTARDIEKAVNLSIPVLGVPTGVKMHSGVFAVNPRAAAKIAAKFLNDNLPVKETEIMDVDEKAFRNGHLSAHLYGYVLSPYEPLLLQGNKMGSPTTESELRNQAAISVYVIENMVANTLYIIGPGTTTRTIADLLDAKKTLLGVDLFYNKKIFAQDVNEKEILDAITTKKAKIIVTPIGGQGFVFGRGNQQISSAVIKAVGLKNIIVVSSKSKLSNLQHLRVDTGDQKLDDLFRANNLKVIIDYGIEQIVKVE